MFYRVLYGFCSDVCFFGDFLVCFIGFYMVFVVSFALFGDFWPFWALLKHFLGIMFIFFLGFLSKS